MTTVRLIGAPTDIGASVRGAGLGPDALRVAGLPEALQLRGLHAGDRQQQGAGRCGGRRIAARWRRR